MAALTVTEQSAPRAPENTLEEPVAREQLKPLPTIPVCRTDVANTIGHALK